MLDAGHCGDVTDMRVAMIPCAVGYAQIAAEIAGKLSKAALEANPYASWIKMYAGEASQQVARDERAYLDRAIHQITPRQQRLFNLATNMEIAFWQMGLDNA